MEIGQIKTALSSKGACIRFDSYMASRIVSEITKMLAEDEDESGYIYVFTNETDKLYVSWGNFEVNNLYIFTKGKSMLKVLSSESDAISIEDIEVLANLKESNN